MHACTCAILNVRWSALTCVVWYVQFAEDSVQQMTAARNLTAFFMASCTDDMTYKVRDFGMKMRLHMVQTLQADTAPDLFVKCANEHRVSLLCQEGANILC